VAQWIVDPDHSVAAFSVRHMTIANVRGQFNKIAGSIYFDPLNIDNSAVELTIDVSCIYTGIQKRDDHLRSPDFFDIDRYPTISFTSTRINSVDSNNAKVSGNLTIHGITRQIIVPVEFSVPVKDPFGDGLSIGFTISATINREDYGIMWNQPMADNDFMVGRDVHFFLDIEADLGAE